MRQAPQGGTGNYNRSGGWQTPPQIQGLQSENDIINSIRGMAPSGSSWGTQPTQGVGRGPESFTDNGSSQREDDLNWFMSEDNPDNRVDLGENQLGPTQGDPLGQQDENWMDPMQYNWEGY